MKSPPKFNRPQLHFTARRNWLNDPNGCIFFEGEWHLFFQHNPHANEWGSHMTWGHAVSPDLVTWRELPPALLPDEQGTIFSGSAVVDAENNAGFQAGGAPPLVAAFTYAGDYGHPPRPFTQALAFSHDRGRTWTKYSGNPILPNLSGHGDRDPRIFRHAETGKWIMVLYVEDAEMSFGIFVSSDLKQWRETQRLPGFFECPELFPLPISSGPEKKLWVLQEANGDYVVGTFDGERFHPLQSKRRLDFGPNYYAAQNFSHVPDGRTIQIGWMRGGHYPHAPFNQQMSFPCELTLAREDGGHLVRRRFARELDACAARAGAKETDAGPFLLRIEFPASVPRPFELEIHGVPFCFDFSRGEVRAGDFHGPFAPLPETRNLEVLVDRTSAEFLLNDGARGGSFCLVPVPGAASWRLSPGDGAACRVEVRPLVAPT